MTEEEQLDLFEDTPKKEQTMKLFYIHETNDELKFPVIGFENGDSDGNQYVADEELNMFAISLLEVLARSCPTRTFTIEWDEA